MTSLWRHYDVMNLSQYVDDLQRHLAVAADAGGADARALAERLTRPLDTAARLVLLEALSAAASEITLDLAPGSVDVRLRGSDPEFVVTLPPTENDFVHVTSPAAVDDEEGGTSRTTLRLPDTLKTRMEEAAAADGLSVNAWLVRAVSTAVASGTKRRPEARDSYTGWAR